MTQKPKRYYLIILKRKIENGTQINMLIRYGRDKKDILDTIPISYSEDNVEIYLLDEPIAYNILREYFRKTYIKKLQECCDYASYWYFEFTI